MGAAEYAEAARRGYKAFQENDVETLQQVLAPDVKWHGTGRNQTAGDFDGLDATLGSFLNLAQLTNGTFGVEVHDVLASDDHAVVLATSKGERNGKTLESNYCHIFHFNDSGQVSEAWVVPVDPYAGDDFFAD
ncbi:MAG: nuclear transport factor 2 family protein [Candidatus Dormiibacterota bacterium]